MRQALRDRRTGSLGRSAVGAFFLVTGGVHLGIVVADPEFYRPFADGAFLPFVRDGWADVVMVHPELYGLLLMAGEIVLGVCLLVGGRAARVGWAGVIAFQLLLVLFGWGFLFWVVPALAVLVPLARRDLGRRQRRRS
ncbi:hypothetical protein [Nocardioides sp. L-11A]|uniref:hypothetical protein n=1 Tax=Nocardioides sp. L-11A TaxID=3043848 RepID=UPI00249A0374|nr:hypothetical protein QJ852_18275 [Nocardioides sp. L-11A]